MPNTSILGHEAVIKSLQNLAGERRLPHALLFSGTEGIGKRGVAIQLSASLLCENAPQACGVCHSCKLLTDGKHPDFVLIEPEEGKIKIDTIRELKKDFSFAPLMGRSRVILIVDAHAMNTAAANALLKTLEEPPADTYFLLLTHAMGWIPRTIVSRCQKIRFSPLAPDLITTIVHEKIDSKILDWAQGSARYASDFTRIQDSVPAVEQLSDSQDWGFNEAYRCAQSVVESEDLEIFLQALLAQTHRSLIAGAAEKSFELLFFADRILEFKKNLRVNANPKLHLARLLMHFQEPLQSRL